MSVEGGGAALIQQPREKEREWKTEAERERGEEEEAKRKIAFRLCSVKGEITHLRRFFQATTGSIDQTTGFMSQFSTWNIDTENPFCPCLLFLLPLFLSQSNGLQREAGPSSFTWAAAAGAVNKDHYDWNLLHPRPEDCKRMQHTGRKNSLHVITTQKFSQRPQEWK